MTGWELPAAAAGLAGLSARWNWWRLRRAGLPVLMYHKVGDPPPGSRLAKLWVPVEDFRWQLRWLLDNGFTPMLMSEAARVLRGELASPERPALVTLDDGYADNYERAFPVLLELGVKANIFLVYECVGRHNAWHDPASEAWVRMLTWGQAAEMAGSGLVEFGGHGMRHRNLASIPLEEARWEIHECKRRLEDKLGRPMAGFAYPYGAGAYVPEVRAAALEAFELDFAIRQGMCPWPWDRAAGPIPRLFIRRDDNRLDFRLHMTRGKSRF